MTVRDRYRSISSQVAACAATCGRVAGSVRLICVSKTAGIADVREAFDAGARDFGENRIESLEPKAAALPGATWHFIGNVQSRKIPRIVAVSTLIHSVWREEHLPAIDRAAARLGKVQDILIEVNVSGEESKDGLAPHELAAFLSACEGFASVRVRGLMTMAPQGDASRAAETFAGLAALRRELISADPRRESTLTELSMGMSEDWESAVFAGATMVRLGRAVFSPDFC